MTITKDIKEIRKLHRLSYLDKDCPGYLYVYPVKNELGKDGVKIGRTTDIIGRFGDNCKTNLVVFGPFINARNAESEYITLMKGYFPILDNIKGIKQAREYFVADLDSAISLAERVEISELLIEIEPDHQEKYYSFIDEIVIDYMISREKTLPFEIPIQHFEYCFSKSLILPLLHDYQKSRRSLLHLEKRFDYFYDREYPIVVVDNNSY